MLGASSVDPGASWVSSSQSTVSLCHTNEASSSVSSQHSTVPLPQKIITSSSLPNVSIKGEFIDEPSTSHAHQVDLQHYTNEDRLEQDRDRASSSGLTSSEEPMTSSTSLPTRRVRVTFRLPARQALRLKRIAKVQPSQLRRMGWSTFTVGRGGESVSVNDLIPPPIAPLPHPPRCDDQRRPDPLPPFDRLADGRVNGPVPALSGGGVAFAPAPPAQGSGGGSVAENSATPSLPLHNRPQINNNNSPLLTNLLSSQQQQPVVTGVNAGPPPPINQQQMGQRSFSPYVYPPQTTHPHASGPPPVMDPHQHQMAMQQQHMQAERERHRMMMHQHQHQQHMQQQHAMAQAQAQAAAAAAANGSTGQNSQSGTGSIPASAPCQPPLTPGGYYPAGNAIAGPSQQRPVSSMNYPQASPMPPGMYPPQQHQRLGGPPYPGPGGPGPVGQVPPQAMPMQPTHVRPPAEESVQPPKKKRKPTKKQQKEAEMAAAQQSAQQSQFVPERMMHQAHMNSGVPMMGYSQGVGYPPGPGVPQFAPYPQGASQQHQQQMWHQHQMQQQQRLMYQQQQAHAAQGAGQQWHPQRAAVPYPPTAAMDGPNVVHPPVSQRTSAEFSQDGTSSAATTPHSSNQIHHQSGNTPSQSFDSHGNMFNFSQSNTSSAENAVDKLWNSQDYHMGDLGDLDDIEPMGELSGSSSLLDAGILDGSTASTSQTQPQPVEKTMPVTPNGDHIDSSIASVVEMVSKNNAQMPSQSSPLVSQAQAIVSSGAPLKRRPSNAQIASKIVAAAEQQHNHIEQIRSQHHMQTPQMCAPPISNAHHHIPQHSSGVSAHHSRVKLENGGSRLNNGHEQLPNGSRRLTPTVPSDDAGTDEEKIGQLVKTLLADEQRKKAADAESKAKQPRKGRQRKADVSKEGSPRDEDELGLLEGGASRVRHPSAVGSAMQAAATNFHQMLARQPQQLVKHQQQLQPKQ